jgi:hypothetical protein
MHINTMEIQKKGKLLLIAAILTGVLISGIGIMKFGNEGTKRARANVSLNNVTQSSLPNVQQETSKIIAGFPNFPLYPSAVIDTSQHTEAVQTPYFQPEHYQAYLTVQGKSVANVITWYTSELQKMGWTIARHADPSQQEDDQNIAFTKNGMNGTLNAEEENTEVTISIFISLPVTQ